MNIPIYQNSATIYHKFNYYSNKLDAVPINDIRCLDYIPDNGHKCDDLPPVAVDQYYK